MIYIITHLKYLRILKFICFKINNIVTTFLYFNMPRTCSFKIQKPSKSYKIKDSTKGDKIHNQKYFYFAKSELKEIKRIYKTQCFVIIS